MVRIRSLNTRAHEEGTHVAVSKKGFFFFKKKGGDSKLQHLDFARPPGPHYYPDQNVLNFADRTGCGALTIVWP